MMVAGPSARDSGTSRKIANAKMATPKNFLFMSVLLPGYQVRVAKWANQGWGPDDVMRDTTPLQEFCLTKLHSFAFLSELFRVLRGKSEPQRAQGRRKESQSRAPDNAISKIAWQYE